ncbi:MAG TPA: sulfur carrier protein ThiS, partial [Kofleriaceae bacterium]|nr:sulfur carrier protein ThiS [Kofleriaceae bacterium]
TAAAAPDTAASTAARAAETETAAAAPDTAASAAARAAAAAAAPGPLMRLTINGDPRDVPAGLTIAGLIEHLGLAGKRVAVERNRQIAPRASHATTLLADGDRLELVTFVGGG